MTINNTFRKLLYVQVTLGVIAYGVAERNPAMVLVAGTLATLSWYVVEGPGGKPLPRWLINTGVVALTLWVLWSQLTTDRPLILGLGQFILGLQVFKLYERKANRDYAALIILSLMQMICASILSAEVMFGALLVLYLVVALLAILAFQLKRGHDEAAEATRRQAPAEREPLRPRLIVSRGHRRQFRATAATVGGAALAVSAVVFILVPRGAGAGLFGEWESPRARAVSGFDDQVRLSGDRHVAPDQQPVMNVAFTRGGVDIGGPDRSFLLRGAVLDQYHPARGQWSRGTHIGRLDRRLTGRGDRLLPGGGDTSDALAQHVTLRARTRDALFAVYAPVAIAGDSLPDLTFNTHDQTLRGEQGRGRGGLSYTVWSSQRPGPEVGEGRQGSERYGWDVFYWPNYARRPVVADPRVRELTESIMAEHGLERDPEDDAHPDDGRIAEAVERHLQRGLRYTLDLPPIPRGVDPIVSFLFETREGHCEYFAAAMAAMLRSVGVRARVVTGYVASDYNTVGGYYVVRQRNAHAWVEAWSPGPGWQTFDPSPPADIEGLHASSGGLLARVRDVYDYLEFRWVSHVIAYDDTQRDHLLARMDDTAGAAWRSGQERLSGVAAWFRTLPERWVFGPLGYLYAGGLVVLIVVAVATLGRTLVRRRLSIRQLQLDAVPRRQQRRLAEHLEFYLRMLKVLDRAGHIKPLWQTPARFAEKLSASDPRRSRDVVPLTDLFYEIRFGERPLDERRAKLIHAHLEHLRQNL